MIISCVFPKRLEHRVRASAAHAKHETHEVLQ